MDRQLCRVCGVVIAAGIGLALTGHGVAAAEPAGASEAASADGSVSTGPDSRSTGPESDGPESDGPESEDTEPEDTDTESEDTDTESEDAEPAEPADPDPTEHEPTGTDADADPGGRDHGSPTNLASGADTATAEPTEAAPTEAETTDAGSASAGQTPAAAAVPTAVAPIAVAAITTPVTFVGKFLHALRGGDQSRGSGSPFLAALLAWARRLDAGAPSSGKGATMLSHTSSQSGATVNVRDYGAVGDGVADDSAAIKAAEAALTSGGRLYFPEGDYRFAQQNPAGNAAVLLKGLSNVTVEFAPGARLLMDNLAANGHGTSHGLRVEGAASHVTILNATIEWVTRPSDRSFGDGISVLGWPSDSPPPSQWTGSTGKVEFVSIVNARIVNAPQTGAVLMGVSDVTVTNMTAVGTLADGLHVNASRRVTVTGLTAQNTGDDGLAFVTYHHDTQPWTYGPGDGPFNQSGLGEWNNGGSVATDITVTGGRANGFRVQGGFDITISDVTISGKEFGFHVNSAKALGPGDWTSLASRDIRISDVTIDNVQTGVVLATNNIDGTDDPKWWDFSGVVISDIEIRNAQNWSVAVETPPTVTSALAGITLRNIDAETGVDADGPNVGGNGGILLASLRDSVIENVRLVSAHAADINLFGAGQIRNQLDVDALPSSNLTVDGLTLVGPGRILIQDIAGVQFGAVSSSGADSAAVVLFRVGDASFGTITADLPGRGSGAGYGVRLLQVFGVDIDDIVVTMDDHLGSSWWAVEFGGGNPQEGIAGRNVHVGQVTYTSERDATGSDVVVQGGPYGPVNWSIDVTWRHSGEPTPQWRSATYGDVGPV